MRRRRFLATGLFGGALLALGGLLESSRYTYPERAGLRVLSGKQLATLAAAAECFAPAGSAPTPEEVARWLDGYLAAAPEFVRADVLRLVSLLEHGPQLFLSSPRRFSALPVPAREAHLLGWAGSRLALRRAGYAAVRELVSLARYSDARTWSAIGYGGPVVPRGWRGGEREPIEPGG